MRTTAVLALLALASCSSVTHKPDGPPFDPNVVAGPDESVIVVYRPDRFTAHGFEFPVAIDNGVVSARLCNAGYLVHHTTPGRHVASLLFEGSISVFDDMFDSDSHVAVECTPGGVHFVRVEAALSGHNIQHVTAEFAGAEIAECFGNDEEWIEGDPEMRLE